MARQYLPPLGTMPCWHVTVATSAGEISSGGFEKIFDHPPPNWAGRPNLP